MSLQPSHEPDSFRRRQWPHDFPVHPDLGRVIAGPVALTVMQPESIVRRVLAQGAAQLVFEDKADVGAAFEEAGRAAAPGNERLRRRRLAELGIIGDSAV